MSEHDDLIDRLRRMSRLMDDIKAANQHAVRMVEDTERHLREKRADDTIRDTSEDSSKS